MAKNQLNENNEKILVSLCNARNELINTLSIMKTNDECKEDIELISESIEKIDYVLSDH